MVGNRDIDYAVVTVKKAIVEKFTDTALEDLQAVAGDRTISIEHAGRKAEGVRGDLLTALRKSTSYTNFWEVLERDGMCVN